MINNKQLQEAVKVSGISLDVSIDECISIEFDDLGLDSLDLFNLFLEIENITGMAIADKDVDTIKSFSDIFDYFK